MPGRESGAALRAANRPAGDREGHARLDELLVCPACRSTLERGSDRLSCAGCGAAFDVLDGKPVLLPPPRTIDPLPEPGPRPRALRRLRRRLEPSLTYKPAATRELASEFAGSVPGTVLNIGSGETDYGPNVVNLDLFVGPAVDVVADAHRLPIRDGAVAGVLLEAVLEHVEDSGRVLEETRRVLSPGGRVYVDVPFIEGVHTASDHRRFTVAGLRGELERRGFAVEATGLSVGPASGMAWVTAEYLALLLSGRSDVGYRLARIVTGWVAWPLKFADAWLHGHPRAYLVSAGVWAVARRG